MPKIIKNRKLGRETRTVSMPMFVWDFIDKKLAKTGQHRSEFFFGMVRENFPELKAPSNQDRKEQG